MKKNKMTIIQEIKTQSRAAGRLFSKIFWLASFALISAVSAAALYGPNKLLADTLGSGSSSDCNSSTSLCNPIQQNSLTDLINQFVTIVLQLGTIVAILFFIYAGFRYITAQGDEAKVKDAHKIFINTAIGTAILLGAKLIATAIQATITGLNTGTGTS